MGRLVLRLWTLILWGAYVVLVVKLGPVMGRIADRLGESNCYAWAIAQQQRHGGFVVMGRSDFVSGRHHFLWSPDLVRFEAYDPPTKRECLRPPLLFVGSPQVWRPPLLTTLGNLLRVMSDTAPLSLSRAPDVGDRATTLGDGRGLPLGDRRVPL